MTMCRIRPTRLRAGAPLFAAAVAALVVTACAGGSGDAARTDTAVAAATPTVTPAAAAEGSGGGGASTTAATTPAAAAGAPAGALLDPNAATREELAAVPGMTAAAADALVAGRPYETMGAVDQALARQLGAAERRTVYARLWKPIDLNAAKGDEILLIPGVGPRMRHEFEEYRPYRSIEQFRREIGKYVDKNEVARLERYVMIK